jgi:alpha-glucosidase
VVENNSTMTGISDELKDYQHPFWGQPGVHEINRKFRKVLDEYEDRAMCG